MDLIYIGTTFLKEKNDFMILVFLVSLFSLIVCSFNLFSNSRWMLPKIIGVYYKNESFICINSSGRNNMYLYLSNNSNETTDIEFKKTLNKMNLFSSLFIYSNWISSIIISLPKKHKQVNYRSLNLILE